MSTVAGTDIPIAYLIFSFQAGGVRVTESGVPPARPTTAARLFVEASGNFGGYEPGSLQTGFAIANTNSAEPVHINFDLTNLDGVATLQGSLDIPAGGQIGRFINEIPGFQSLPASFQGVLRISSTTSPISMIGLRGRYNERREFLVTTIPPVNEDDPYFQLRLKYSEFIFPHFADGGGYTTQFVLHSGWTPGPSNASLNFFTNSGTAFPLTLKPR